ncbi:hypothetical protein ACFQLX_01150 [Streptomyces polyrhachis]|uniref:Uncharacterized protein n=1 Tax=Streptomyces polyrhachis TaxID=1282885 RepID=A0ABW2GBH8_9ACTN
MAPRPDRAGREQQDAPRTEPREQAPDPAPEGEPAESDEVLLLQVIQRLRRTL